MKKYTVILCCIITLVVTNVTAQKLIPFQYQSKAKWDYNAKWGFMDENRKIIKEPYRNSIAQKVVTAPYFYNANKIIEGKAWKIVWDSIETKGLREIKNNIASFYNPLRGTYQSYSFKNIKTKKLIAAEGVFSSIKNFVIIEDAQAESYNLRKGVIDENGKVIVPAKYAYIYDEGYNFFVAKNDEGYFIFNKEGKVMNTEPYSDVKNNIYNSPDKIHSVAVRKTKGSDIIKYILLTPAGKELPQYFYNKSGNNPFPFDDGNGNKLTAKKSTYDDSDFYTSELCKPETKVSLGSIINVKGALILNNSGYTKPRFLSDNLLTAYDANNREYLLNEKSEKLLDVYLRDYEAICSNSSNNFIVANKDIGKIFFYTYNSTNKAKLLQTIEMKDSIKIEEVRSAFEKYYIVKVKDFKKQQFVTYIYDNTSKLILESEDGFWMFDEGFLIKYLLNEKGDKIYLGYYDIDLKPYSIIKE